MHSLSTQAVQRFSDWLVFAMIEEHVEENRSVEATWGPWATVGLSMVAGLVQLPIAIFVVILVFIWLVATGSAPDPQVLEKSLENYEGLILNLSITLSVVPCVALTIFFARRGGKNSWQQYLAFQPVSKTTVCYGVAIAAAFILVSDSLTYLLGRPIVTEWMLNAYETSKFAGLFWITLCIAAPVFEETLFRGFLFRGFASSRVGPIGAIVITSLVWSLIHIQYDMYGLVTIFFMGLILGMVRLRTHSIYPCIAMHCFNNAIATLEIVLLPGMS